MLATKFIFYFFMCKGSFYSQCYLAHLSIYCFLFLVIFVLLFI